ncbi:hypothetical protein D3C81_10110 [compost metagenome]
MANVNKQNVTKQEEQIDALVEKRINSMSIGRQTSLILTAQSFRFGGNWGFIKFDDPEFAETLKYLKEEKASVSVVKLSNGVLVSCNKNFLAENVNIIIPNGIGASFQENAKRRAKNEQEAFLKFLKRVADGKDSHIVKKNGYYDLTLGIYSINDTNYIRINGNEYPAYKLTLLEALDFAMALVNAGKKVFAKAVKENGEVIYDNIFNLASNSKGKAALFKGLEIADSKTGIFLSLRLV